MKKRLFFLAVFVFVVVVIVLAYMSKTGQLRKPGVRPKPRQVTDKSVVADFERAESLFKSGQTEEALRVYEDFIGKHPGHALSGQVLARIGSIYEDKGMTGQALKVYKRIEREYPETESVDKIQTRLKDLRLKLLFSTAEQEGCVFYEVKYGDNLDKIAGEFGTTIELIKRSNNLSSDVIFPGQRLKICRINFSLLVDKSLNVLMLKNDETVWKTYPVSTGANNSTPTGTFKVVNKKIDPPWFHGGKVIPPGSPENILGSRWLGLDIKGYGIHGTREPESIGKQITNGCVRMLNEDVEEIYTIVPEGTEVTIID